MADNRLWLRHKPSGKTICLGKRLGWGWNAGPNLNPDSLPNIGGWLQEFFDECRDASGGIEDQDDFELVMEVPAKGGILPRGPIAG